MYKTEIFVEYWLLQINDQTRYTIENADDWQLNKNHRSFFDNAQMIIIS